MHLLAPPARGPWRPPQLMAGEDTCAADIGARGARTERMVALVLRVRQQTVHNAALRALRKLAPILGISDEQCKTLLKRRA